MWKTGTSAVVSAMIGVVVTGQPAHAAQSDVQKSPDPVKCEYVVSADFGAKPVQQCMTQSEWAAKKKQDSADANRIVCHYEDEPGTRFRSRKICMSAAQWDDKTLQDRQDVERIQLQGSMLKGP